MSFKEVKFLANVNNNLFVPDHFWDPMDVSSFNGPATGVGSIINDIGKIGTANFTRTPNSEPVWASSTTTGKKFFQYLSISKMLLINNGTLPVDVNDGFTFSAWIAPKINAATFQGVFANALYSSESYNGYKCILNPNTGKMGVQMGDGSTGTTVYGPDAFFTNLSWGNMPFNLYTWIFDRQNNEVRMYVDDDDPVTVALPANVNLGDKAAGASSHYTSNTTANFFYGNMGAWAIWGRATENKYHRQFFHKTKNRWQ